MYNCSTSLSLANESLKLYASWLELQQKYIEFLEDCNAFYGRIFN